MLISNFIYLKSNPKLYQYLKENSEWLKQLNRSNHSLKKFESFIKDKYHLKKTDKISDVLDNLDIVTNLLSTLK